MTAHDTATGLRHRAVRGVAWSSADTIGSRLISAVVFIALARLLPPSAFGLVALSLAFVAFTRLLVDQGLGAAIVQRPELTRSHLDTSFWTTLATGAVLTVGLFALATPASVLLGQPDLEPVVQALSFVVLVAAPSSTAAAVLKRELDFRGIAQRRLIAAVVGGAAGIGAAVAGLGVWALVVQALVQTLVSTVTLWVVTPYRPGLQVSRRAFTDLFGFSNKVIGISVVNFAAKHSDDLLIGGVLGPAALGLYSVAYRLLAIMSEVLTATTDRVTFSAFARIQGDRARLTRAYTASVRITSAVAAPAFLLVAVLAEDVVLTFFGVRWEESVPVMAALSVAGVAHAVAASSNTFLLSVGRARSALLLSALYATAGVAVFAASVSFGIVAVAIAFTVRSFALAPVGVHQVRRVLGMSWGEWLRLAVPPTFTGLASALVVLVAGRVWLVGAPAPLRLVVLGALGALLYVVLLRLVHRQRWRELWAVVRQVRP